MHRYLTSKPLDNFPLVRSRSFEEVRSGLARAYARPDMQPRHRVDDLDATINDCQLQHIGLCYGTYGAAAEFIFPPTGFVCRLFPLNGKGEAVTGETSIALSAGAGAVISDEAPHKTKVSADYEHLVLRINAQALAKRLATLTGATSTEPLRIASAQNPRHPAAQMLQQYLPLLVGTLNAAVAPFPDWWVAQTEQLLMTLFLCGHQHNYSHLLEQDPPDPALWQVRRAEEYIEANAERTVTLEEIAQVAGVSYCSLSAAFGRLRGYSPLEFVAQVRWRRGAAVR
jgi:AraC-binding-like domain